MKDWLFSWSGQPVGWRDGDDLWSLDGRHVGRFVGDDLFAADGRYAGELMAGDRLITAHGKGWSRREPFLPKPARPAPRNVPPAREGFAVYVGYQDFLRP